MTLIPPFARAWERTRTLLFRPFVPEAWLVIAFAAFLSRLAQGATAGTGWRFGADPDSGLGDWLVLLLFGPLFALTVIIGALLLWISSRGQFVFLDDVLSGRGAIVEPWLRFARLGNSLFLWRLGLLVLLAVVAWATIGPIALFRWLDLEGGVASVLGTLGAITAFGLLGVSGLIVLLANVLLDAFVVPLMYRYGLRTSEAWSLFLPVLRRNPLSFLMYVLFLIVLWIGLAVTVIAFGCALCCVPFCLLLLPYVNTVLLLPFFVLLRLFSVEFLAQLGEAYVVTASDASPARP